MVTKKINKDKDIKMFQMRVPKDLWIFLKKSALDQETSMMEIIVKCLTKYKKNIENKLTDK